MRRIAILVLVVALDCAAAAPASAFYQRYVGASIWSPGSSSSSNTNRLTYNAVSFWACCGGSPYMGTTYARTDGTGPPYIYSNTGSIFDSRTIAYGYAICRASASNQYNVYIDYCDTGNT